LFSLPSGPYTPLFNNLSFASPITSKNLVRIARGLQLNLHILIEGPPGVGKTSLVQNLGQALDFNVVRINLNEHSK
jgi:midasin